MDTNIELTVDAEIAGLIVAAWLGPLAKLNLPNPIRARALGDWWVTGFPEPGWYLGCFWLKGPLPREM